MNLYFRNSKYAKKEVLYPQPFDDALKVEAFVYPLTPSPGIIYSTGKNTVEGCVIKAEANTVLNAVIEVGVDVRVFMPDGSFVYKKFN
jgi:hypothetical protein